MTERRLTRPLGSSRHERVERHPELIAIFVPLHENFMTGTRNAEMRNRLCTARELLRDRIADYRVGATEHDQDRHRDPLREIRLRHMQAGTHGSIEPADRRATN